MGMGSSKAPLWTQLYGSPLPTETRWILWRKVFVTWTTAVFASMPMARRKMLTDAAA